MKRDPTVMREVSASSVFGVASSRLQASCIVNHLADAGFTRDHISVLFPDTGGRFAAGNCRNPTASLLIRLRAGGWHEAQAARKIFQTMGASNITLGGEKAARFLTVRFHASDSEMTGRPATAKELQISSCRAVPPGVLKHE